MKKIILGIIGSLLFISSLNADILIPGAKPVEITNPYCSCMLEYHAYPICKSDIECTSGSYNNYFLYVLNLITLILSFIINKQLYNKFIKNIYNKKINKINKDNYKKYLYIFLNIFLNLFIFFVILLILNVLFFSGLHYFGIDIAVLYYKYIIITPFIIIFILSFLFYYLYINTDYKDPIKKNLSIFLYIFIVLFSLVMLFL